MATVKKKAAPKKKAAAAKPAEVSHETPADKDNIGWPADKELPDLDAKKAEAAPAKSDKHDAPVTREEISKMIAAAVEQSTQQIVAAVTQVSPQTIPDDAAKPGPGGPPAGMMTTYGTVVAETDVDLELLELTDPIGYQLAMEGDDGPAPGGRRKVEAAIDDGISVTLTQEQIEGMSEEEIDEYNRKELQRVRARKQQQLINRSRLEKMSPGDRIRALTERDPNRIRQADNPLDERMIKCVATNRIGLGVEGTSDPGETIYVPLSGARMLQDQGRIRVLI